MKFAGRRFSSARRTALWALAWGCTSLGAVAQSGGLVIGGETIAPADLLAKAKTEGSISLYSGYFEFQERAMAAAFTKDTGVQVRLLTLSGGTMIERVLSEYGAKKLDADVIRLTDPSYQARMVAAGVLAPYKVPNWAVIPATLKDNDGHYMASFLSMVVFGYNKNLVSDAQAPRSWQDLSKPEWGPRKIGMWDINAGGSPWGIALVQRQKWGVEYWRKMAALDIKFFPQGAPAAEEVARGEIPITVNGVEAVATVVKDGAPIKMVFPSDGVIVIPHYIAIASTAPRPNAARLFANWSASKRAAAVAAEAGAYTSNPDAPSIKLEGQTLPRPNEIPIVVPDAQAFITLRKDWIPEWRTVFKR